MALPLYYIYVCSLLILFPRIFVFLFDTLTVSWSFVDTVSSSFGSQVHTYKQIIICIFMPLFFFLSRSPLLLLALPRVFLFFLACTRSLCPCSSFSFLFCFFFLSFLLLQCQHHERCTAGRQSTITCFTQLKESSGSNNNSSSKRLETTTTSTTFYSTFAGIRFDFFLFSVSIFILFPVLLTKSSINPSLLLLLDIFERKTKKKKENRFETILDICMYLYIQNNHTNNEY